MDPVQEIKSRLSIEQLVGRYVQLQKKGRNFVGLCPFHHDTRPSFLVSPDKGICYCFPCQKGGDIFSFYQLVEGVEFKQAIKDLADIAGVVLPEHTDEPVKKDEKERLRDCLTYAKDFYAQELKKSGSVGKYLNDRGLEDGEIESFGLGLAPDSFNATYDHLLKAGFSRKEILAAGMGIQKDLNEERIYDRFRNRLMFPIFDTQGRIIGFGGRTLGNDDAKYLNTNDGPLYRKSSVLFGLDKALHSMRERKRVVLVEGYFDVLACHRVGVTEAVATCGTALTEEHVRLLKRYVENVTLCLDQDKAGKDAAERAYKLCSREGLTVEGCVLGQKDPADAAVQSREILQKMLTTEQQPYLDLVFDEIRASDLSSPAVRHAALERILSLIESIATATERTHAVRQAAVALSTTETALFDDLQKFEKNAPVMAKVSHAAQVNVATLFSSAELTLGLFLLYPRNIALLEEMIPPEGGFAEELYRALKTVASVGPSPEIDIETLELSDEEKKQTRILELYCEENGLANWSESLATREVRHNLKNANREMLMHRQKDITRRLLEARKNGHKEEESELTTQYQQILELARMSKGDSSGK